MSCRVLGLTGFYCSGKSTVEKILEEQFGYIIIDADKVGHQVLSEYQDVLVDAFGTQILTDGKIDRKILGKIVFANPEKLQQLNQITHPLIFDKIKQTVNSTNDKYVVSAALYFETGCDSLCQHTLVVKAPILTIIKRGMKRDGHSVKRILNILKSQKLISFLKQKDVTVINNNCSKTKLAKKIQKLGL